LRFGGRFFNETEKIEVSCETGEGEFKVRGGSKGSYRRTDQLREPGKGRLLEKKLKMHQRKPGGVCSWNDSTKKERGKGGGGRTFSRERKS